MARLFLGVELEPEAKAAAAAAADQLRSRLVSARVRIAARWVPHENLHITLWFIGEVAEDRAQAIRDALARPFAVAPFPIEVAGLGAFPPSGEPRVFWIGLASGADGMGALYAETTRRFAPLGYEPERRPYSAHLTIARVKEMSRPDGPVVRRILRELPVDAGVSRVAAVTLFRSRLSPKGAAYDPLVRVPLE